MYVLEGCDKEDESDVTFTAFCPPILLSWSTSPLESSGSAARQGNFFVLYERTFYFVFDCYVSNKRTLYLYYVIDVSDKRTFYFVFDCYVSNKRTLYLYFVVTLAINALSILYLIVTLVIGAHYISTL